MRVLIGTPVHRDGAYALEKYLANQQQIQQACPDCDLVLATNDAGYAGELEAMLLTWRLRGEVITYQVQKPGYTKSRLWNIASGRESIRRYFLYCQNAESLLCLDADMTYDPQVIGIMEKEMAGYGAVFSGYRLRDNRIGLAGAGCLMLRRQALEKIRFRCYEFRNGQVINEDNMVEMDLFRQRYRIKKGYFLTINHYYSSTEATYTSPQKVGLYQKVATCAFVRFCLLRASVALHYNIPFKGQQIKWALTDYLKRVSVGSTLGALLF